MVAALIGSIFVTRSLHRLAVLTVALALPFGLAACGVRGGLEPPPSAAASAPAEAPPLEPVTARPGIGQPTPAPRLTPTQRAAAGAPSAERRNPLDWLIN